MDDIACLDKAITLLEILCEKSLSFSVTELSKISGLNRTTVHRIMKTLEKRKVVIKNKNKLFKIGPNAYRMGCVYLDNFNYEDMIPKILNEIAEKTQESVGYAIKEGNTILSLFEVEINQPFKMNYKPGLYYPINRGCYGKCLMAYHDKEETIELLTMQKFEKITSNTLTELDEIIAEYEKIKTQGFVTSECEVSSYHMGVGIPIYNSKRQVKACLAVSFVKGTSGISDNDKIEKLKNVLLSYQEEFSKYIP